MTERLTTLAAVKEWLEIPEATTTADALLTRLITAASLFVLNWLNRDSFQKTTYTENFRGNGKTATLLKNFPILSVSQVGVAGQAIPPAQIGNVGMPSNGYTISDERASQQAVDLFGYEFCWRAPCQVIYSAGYEATDTSTLSAPVDPATWIIYAPTADGQWSCDQGVTLNGVVQTLSATNDPPVGSYYVDMWGNYSFNAAAAGEVAVISYSYTPYDVSWACTELVGEFYRRQERIGLLSKTLGGQETVSFDQKDMSASVKMVLQPFVNVVPI